MVALAWHRAGQPRCIRRYSQPLSDLCVVLHSRLETIWVCCTMNRLIVLSLVTVSITMAVLYPPPRNLKRESEESVRSVFRDLKPNEHPDKIKQNIQQSGRDEYNK
jgi:hypothetical protein